MIECIVENEKDAIAAEKLGASRLELVSAIQLGGLTPSFGTIKRTVEAVQIPVQIMVRPHNYGFIYNTHDKEAMKEDIALLYDMGHYRIVIGVLDQNKKIETNFLDDIFKEFPDLDVTFHRAFDEVEDQIEAYRTLVSYRNNIKRVLTSGGANSCMAGIESLRKLVQLQRKLNGPGILPGSGVKLENIKELHEAVQADEYHFGSGVRKYQSYEEGFDKEVVGVIKHLLSD
ncbi:copper homeostasis protein CutC [Virgibacillus indicus]|uniref:PF03932 family protein CutC n=1 Tax=Virgibacillus indicus TaxID=2024554 RepID=A0A265N5P4_9BACI|nr:copper homeostasis protein CutC [Virgibacillus indicus]OZU87177.1 copper homeostasis protein CutC [Virgibacillus indicus]